MARLIILGASARAAAGSARRAGFDPWCADLFGDTDLLAMAPDSVRCPADRYPRGFVDILCQAPAGPWMYTGALENHPKLVRKLAELRPLWGSGPKALARSRSPFTLHRLLTLAGLPAAAVRPAEAEPSLSHRWLRKPLAGSAGQGIVFADASPPPTAACRRRSYEQQFIDGLAMSAVFVRGSGETRLFGITRQLIGEPLLNAPPFRYAGNIGPIQLPAGAEDRLRQIGCVVGEGCGLTGVFGVDFIWDGERPWVVEVNPRYPASVEVIERATGGAVLAHHAAAFGGAAPPVPRPEPRPPVVGKAILYAPRQLAMPEGIPPGRGGHSTLPIEGPAEPAELADIPAPGEMIERGWPILSVFAAADDQPNCRAQLEESARRLTTWLLGPDGMS